MKTLHKMRFITLLGITVLVVLLVGMLTGPTMLTAATTTVNLGTAGSFAVLAGSAVNDTTPSNITGDVGLSPAAWLSALTCGEVTGWIYSVDASGPLPCRVENAGLLTIAKNDLTTAYNDAAGRPRTATIATELGGQALTDGVYDSASGTFEIAAGATLTLNGDASSVFIFKMGTTLVTGSASRVLLGPNVSPCNVFWQVGSSATLGTGTTFVGTIMADQSITDNGGSTINGRLLARIAAVTLNNTTITNSSCSGSIPPATLHVIKHVINDNGGTAVAANFNLHVKTSGTDISTSPAPGVESPGTTYTLAPGTYVVSEDAFAGYTASYSGDSDSSGNITLASGDNKTVTITNNDIATTPGGPTETTGGPTETTGAAAETIAAAETTGAPTETTGATAETIAAAETTVAAPVTTTVAGGQLPKTSTPWYNLILVGAALILIGAVGWIIARKINGKSKI